MQLNRNAFWVLSLPLLLASCLKDDITDVKQTYRSNVYNYSVNKGQVLNQPRYWRALPDSARLQLVLDELPESQTKMTLYFYYFPQGVTYPVTVHKKSDTMPYRFAANADSSILIKDIPITGTVTIDSVRVAHSFDYLTKIYQGYLLVRDTQPDTSLNLDYLSPARFPIFGTFAR